MKARADRYNAAIGRQIRAEISAARRSILGVAQDLGIARSTLNNYVTGERDIPIPIAYQIAELLEIDPQVLIQRATERFHAEDKADQSNVVVGRFDVGGSGQNRLRPAARARDTEPTDET